MVEKIESTTSFPATKTEQPNYQISSNRKTTVSTWTEQKPVIKSYVRDASSLSREASKQSSVDIRSKSKESSETFLRNTLESIDSFKTQIREQANKTSENTEPREKESNVKNDGVKRAADAQEKNDGNQKSNNPGTGNDKETVYDDIGEIKPNEDYNNTVNNNNHNNDQQKQMMQMMTQMMQMMTQMMQTMIQMMQTMMNNGGNNNNNNNNKIDGNNNNQPQKWNDLITAWRQGGQGNCVSVAVIKAAMTKFGNQVFQSMEKLPDGSMKFLMKDGKEVQVTGAELEIAKRMCDWKNLGGSKELEYAQLCYAAIAKRALENRHEGARTFAQACHSLNNGEDVLYPALLLGLKNNIKRIDLRNLGYYEAAVTWNSGHALFSNNGKIDGYGNVTGAGRWGLRGAYAIV